MLRTCTETIVELAQSAKSRERSAVTDQWAPSQFHLADSYQLLMRERKVLVKAINSNLIFFFPGHDACGSHEVSSSAFLSVCVSNFKSVFAQFHQDSLRHSFGRKALWFSRIRGKLFAWHVPVIHRFANRLLFLSLAKYGSQS